MKRYFYLCAMKTMGKMKRCTRLAFALLVALLLQTAAVHAQEMIRSIGNSGSQFSLARMSNNYQQWVVYSENADLSLFGRMDTSGLANVFVRMHPHVHVKDMTISGGMLYFCGNMYDEDAMGEIGVMGFFRVSDFSTPSTMKISYIKFKEFKELRKLTYYETSWTKHVPMVGTGTDGRDYIVDAYYASGLPPSYWRRAWMYIPNIDAMFDDIICIKDSVVVSSRIEKETEVQLCFIPKTGLEGHAFFSPTLIVEMVKVPDQPFPIDNRVLLQGIGGNRFYAFYRYGPYLDVCHFIGKSNLNSIHIAILHIVGYFPESFSLKDVCVDKKMDEMSVLLTKKEYLTQSYQILHIPTVLPSTGGSVSGHVYDPTHSYYPKSLCGGKDYHTVTMGEFMDDWGMARVVNSQFDRCSDRVVARTTFKDEAYKPSVKDYNVIGYEAEVLSMPVTVLEYPVIFQCSDYPREENNDNK